MKYLAFKGDFVTCSKTSLVEKKLAFSWIFFLSQFTKFENSPFSISLSNSFWSVLNWDANWAAVSAPNEYVGKYPNNPANQWISCKHPSVSLFIDKLNNLLNSSFQASGMSAIFISLLKIFLSKLNLKIIWNWYEIQVK